MGEGMEGGKSNRAVRVHQHGSFGIVWLIGWLFSIGFLKMGFWKGVLALFVWPYFLGVHFADHPALNGEQAVVIEEMDESGQKALPEPEFPR